MTQKVLRMIKWDAWHHWRFLRWWIAVIVIAWAIALTMPVPVPTYPVPDRLTLLTYIPHIVVAYINIGMSAVASFIVIVYPTISLLRNVHRKTALMERLINIPSYLLLGLKLVWNLAICAMGIGMSVVSTNLMGRFATGQVTYFTFESDYPLFLWIYMSLIIPSAALAFYLMTFAKSARLSIPTKIIATVLFIAIVLNNTMLINTNEFTVGGTLPSIASIMLDAAIVIAFLALNCWLLDRKVEVG